MSASSRVNESTAEIPKSDTPSSLSTRVTDSNLDPIIPSMSHPLPNSKEI